MVADDDQVEPVTVGALPGYEWHRVWSADETALAPIDATPSVDFVCVLSGEIWLELDEREVHLRAGDTVVQNATRHAWRNKGLEPCRLAICLLGLPASVMSSP